MALTAQQWIAALDAAGWTTQAQATRILTRSRLADDLVEAQGKLTKAQAQADTRAARNEEVLAEIRAEVVAAQAALDALSGSATF